MVSFPDYSLPFHLYVDMFLTSIGAVLVQMRADKEHVIVSASRTLLTAENYYSIKQEYIGII